MSNIGGGGWVLSTRGRFCSCLNEVSLDLWWRGMYPHYLGDKSFGRENLCLVGFGGGMLGLLGIRKDILRGGRLVLCSISLMSKGLQPTIKTRV